MQEVAPRSSTATTDLLKSATLPPKRTDRERIKKIYRRIRGVDAYLIAPMNQAMNNELSSSKQQQWAPTARFRTPKRITITLPHGTYQRLIDRSDHEGRSLSNLAAFLLETAA
jgi:hypothetical protein